MAYRRLSRQFFEREPEGWNRRDGIGVLRRARNCGTESKDGEKERYSQVCLLRRLYAIVAWWPSAALGSRNP